MRICSKCKIDKETSEFYTYWHSKYNKHFIRRTCTSCYIKHQLDNRNERKLKLQEDRKEMIEVLTQQIIDQPDVPELEPVVLEGKKCLLCKENKPFTEFYQNKSNGYYHARCKKCHLEYSNKRLHEYYQKKYETCGGSERILPKPNTYMDKYQEAQTHWVMELMGWKLNDNGVWSKEGIKDKDNNWYKIPKKEKIIQLRKSRAELKINDIKNIVELRNKGLLMREIAVIYNCSKTLIGTILMKENEKKD
jgi:hypothetical protein